MRMTSVLCMLAVFVLLAGCASSASHSGAFEQEFAESSGGDWSGSSARVTGAFAGHRDVERFIHRMASRHHYDPHRLAAILSQAQREQWIINLMDRQAPRRSTGPNGAWIRYRAKFITSDNLANGTSFWRQYREPLQRASRQYGVPPEYIVAIIGIETRYGRIVGNTRIIDALATLAFEYPRRADYFTDELEAFLLMSRKEEVDPLQPRGSYAGAMGLGQFMPSSYRDYAVDFTGDGHRNLWNATDAIGSVANYFKAHGWQSGQVVTVRAQVRPGAGASALEAGFDTRYSPHELEAHGITADLPRGVHRVSLLRLDVGGGYQYWVGFENFYVITRYNNSTYYAMAVHQLAQALRARMGADIPTRESRQSRPASGSEDNQFL